MIASHLIEKLKIGKRFVLVDLVVQPDGIQEPWESAGPENKFLSLEVWQMVYRKLEEVCQKHFGEFPVGSSKLRATRFQLDKEYEHRLPDKPNILVRYEFKGGHQRDNLNIVFNEGDKKLHKDCLHVQILDETREMYRELQDKRKDVERLQKENDRLKDLPEASQEYTPLPMIKLSGGGGSGSSSSSVNAPRKHSEYIPTAINGSSPAQSSSYKASKIASTHKPEPDPYTPSSSQESDIMKLSYVPTTFVTPVKIEVDQKSTVSSSGESRIGGKKRCRRQVEIFGQSDDEEECKPSSSTKKKHDLEGNRSVEDIFNEDSPSKAVDIIGSSSDEIAVLGSDNKRTQLPRKSKNNILYKNPASPEAKHSQSAGSSKRRRKETDPVEEAGSSKDNAKSSGLNKSKDIPTWLGKGSGSSSSSRKEGESSSSSSSKHHSKDKDKDKDEKRKKDSKPKKEAAAPTVPIPPVDREKLREEVEIMRKTIASLDKLDKMLPEDKTQLDVPILDCFKLTTKDVMDTFEEHRVELQDIFDRYKDQSERQWQKADELCYYTEVTSVLDDDQKYAMMKRVEDEFVPTEERGKYTEFFSSTLIMEWGLRIWMRMFHFTDRREALDRIRLQEEANPMEMTPSLIASLTGSIKKKR